MTRRLLFPFLTAIALAGCARDQIHRMASLKDDMPETAQRSVAAEADKADKNDKNEKDAVAKSAEHDADDKTSGKTDIETGSIDASANCQGEHLAYQATKEYLKNFGPKPEARPGDIGPCHPKQ